MRSIPIFLVLMVTLILLSDDRRGSESCCFGKPKTLSAQTETTNPPRPIKQQPMPQKNRAEPPSLTEEQKELTRNLFADLKKDIKIKAVKQDQHTANNKLIADNVDERDNYFEQCCKDNYITNGQHFELYWMKNPTPVQVDGKTVQCEADSNGNVQFETIFPILRFLKDKKLNQDFTYEHADVAKFAESILDGIERECKEKLHCAEFAKCILTRGPHHELPGLMYSLRKAYGIKEDDGKDQEPLRKAPKKRRDPWD